MIQVSDEPVIVLPLSSFVMSERKDGGALVLTFILFADEAQRVEAWLSRIARDSAPPTEGPADA